MAIEAPSQNANGIGIVLTKPYTVADKDTVGALVSGMPMVAATPYIVTIAEMVCHEMCGRLIEAGHITVGTRVVIDHLLASKVGAVLSVTATLRSRENNRFYFGVTVKNGNRIVAKIEHTRNAVAFQRLLATLG